jgi:hypothetical protein
MGMIVALMYRPFSTIENGDASIYDYIGQTILRGGLPYRDVVDIKGPGTMYLTAIAMLGGKWFGIRDIIAVRISNVVLAGALSCITFMVAWAYLRDRMAAVIAVLIPLMMGSFTIMMNGGPQPKLPLMIFGLASIYLVAKDRPFWSGFCSMLACLCWQPGLLFTGVVVLIFTRYLTRWRSLDWLKVLAGAAVPLATTLAYFYCKGALGELWSWTITFNYSVFAPDGLRPIGEALLHFWNVGRKVYGWDSIVVWIGVAGLAWFGYLRARADLANHGVFASSHLYRDAIVIPPLVYFAFCMINFQKGPDLIPFLPFIGIFVGWFITRSAGLLTRYRVLEIGGRSISARRALCLFSIAVLSIITLYRAARFRPPDVTLQDQYSEADKFSALLGPGGKTYVQGPTELLVLLNIPNLNPYVALNSGADDYIAATRPGGFGSLIDEMETQAPGAVAVNRLGKVHHAAELMRWVNDHYDKWDEFTYAPVYIRKPDNTPR